MRQELLLMRWGVTDLKSGIPLAKINSIHKEKIRTILSTSTRTVWYGYTTKEWLEAFKLKENAEKNCREDNIRAAHELAQRRRRKDYERSKACLKLLNGICNALNLQ